MILLKTQDINHLKDREMKYIVKTNIILLAFVLIFSACSDDNKEIIQPNAISNFSATADILKVTLNWDNPNTSNFDSYWLSYMPGDELIVIEDPSQTSLELDIDEDEAGKEHRFTLVYVTTENVRSLSSIVAATPQPKEELPEIIFEGDMIIGAQADLDNLPLPYTHITGKLRIKGADITDLSKLADLREVTKNLEIIDSNTSLVSIEGLNSLQKVGGNLWIRRNQLLESVEPLQSLTEVGGNMYFYENDAITSLEGFNSLVEVGDMFIGDRDGDTTDGEGNPLLSDFCALQNLFSIASNRTVLIGENAFNPTVEQVAAGNCSN